MTMPIIALTGVVSILAAASLFSATKKNVTPADAKSFLEKAEAELNRLSVDSSRADWVKSNFITDDTEILAAQADERVISTAARFAKEAAIFSRLALDPPSERKLKLLKNSLTLAAPADPAESAEVTRIVAAMEGTYGKGKYCPGGTGPLS